MSEHPITLAFAPLEYVTVKLFDLKYHGRVNECIVKAAEVLYNVEYADDKGDLVIRTFRADELAGRT